VSVGGWLEEVAASTAPARPIAVTRIIVGCAATAKAAYLALTILPELGPRTIRAPYWTGVPEVTPTGLALLLAIWTAAAVAFALGWRTRLAGVVLTSAVAGTLFVDQQLYSNHLYLLLILALLLTLARSSADLSLDARRFGARDSIPGWPVTLLKFQLSIVYGYSALAKLNAPFLSGGIILVHWRESGLIPLPDALARIEVMFPLAIAAVMVELLLAFAFWSPRLVKGCIAAGIALHVVIVMTMGDVVDLSIFAALMFSMFPLYSREKHRLQLPTIRSRYEITDRYVSSPGQPDGWYSSSRRGSHDARG
jgi:hypothetical protein